MADMPPGGRYRVLTALCAAAAVAYLQWPLLGLAERTIRDQFSLTSGEMGLLLSSWLWTYALFQIPAGRLADRWGARSMLMLHCAVWSMTTLLVPVAPSYSMLLGLGLIFGVAQAGLFPCAGILIRQRFLPEQRGLATGMIGRRNKSVACW